MKWAFLFEGLHEKAEELKTKDTKRQPERIL